MAHSSTSGEFTIGEFRLEWSVSHFAGPADPQDKFRGRSARVRLIGGKNKELVVNFPPREYVFAKQTATLAFQQRLETCVRKAIELGWDPESRGKPHHVDAVDCE